MSIEVDWSEARVPNALASVRAEHTFSINSSGSRQELVSSSESVDCDTIGAAGMDGCPLLMASDPNMSIV